jgi:hypothetical protein
MVLHVNFTGEWWSRSRGGAPWGKSGESGTRHVGPTERAKETDGWGRSGLWVAANGLAGRSVKEKRFIFSKTNFQSTQKSIEILEG